MYKDQGNSKYKAKDYGAAILCYSTAIAKEPSVATYRLKRAVTYIKMQQYAEAVEDCDAAIALDADLAKAYFRKGKALLAKGMPVEAMGAFTTGLIKEPGNAAAKADRKTAEECSQRLRWRQCLKRGTCRCEAAPDREAHVRGGYDHDGQALACIGKASEAYALTTFMMRSNSRYPGLLFWRASP